MTESLSFYATFRLVFYYDLSNKYQYGNDSCQLKYYQLCLHFAPIPLCICAHIIFALIFFEKPANTWYQINHLDAEFYPISHIVCVYKYNKVSYTHS